MFRQLATLSVLLAAMALLPARPARASEWLAVCSKCLSPTVISKSGIGTANAVAEARITREGAAEHCSNWTPERNLEECVAEAMAQPDAQRTYRATADCKAGRITPIDGQTYRLDGVWDRSDIGAGRTRWRDAAGRVVGRDNASGGLGISQQWEVLCPGPLRATARPGPAPATRRAAPQSAPAAAFRVGQVVEAQYGRQWIRGRVTRLHQTSRHGHAEFDYEVMLDNHKRGIVPARMLREPRAQ